jgi:hypothetical protein
MKRSINRWTTTLATVAMLGLPIVGFAQDPAPQQQPAQPQQPQPAQPQPAQPEPAKPQPTQPPADPQPAQPQPQPQQQPASPTVTPQPAPSAQAVSPQEHLSQAKAAVDSIAATSVPAKSRSEFAKLKKHLAALEKAGPATTPATPPATAAKSNVNWGTEVAAIDKIITEMLGSETTGATATPGAAGTSGKAAAAVALDDATRAKLMEVRTHITAYAAGMSGAATPKTDAPAATPEPTTAAATPAEQPPSTTPAATPAAPAPAATAATTPSAATPSAATPSAATPSAATPAESPAAAAAPSAAAQPQVDADAARRALTAARDSLSQLTQLPAAAQLTGETRTQVGQLIANFNELITAQSNWRASYAKVDANLTALLGPDTGAAATAEAPAAAAATPPTATAGAVGTAGATKVELDPAVRAKLVDLRKNLMDFQKASGGVEVK